VKTNFYAPAVEEKGQAQAQYPAADMEKTGVGLKFSGTLNI